MYGTAAKVWTPPSVRNTLISMDEKCFQIYVTDALGSVNKCNFVHIPDDGPIALLGVPTEKYTISEVME